MSYVVDMSIMFSMQKTAMQWSMKAYLYCKKCREKANEHHGVVGWINDVNVENDVEPYRPIDAQAMFMAPVKETLKDMKVWRNPSNTRRDSKAKGIMRFIENKE